MVRSDTYGWKVFSKSVRLFSSSILLDCKQLLQIQSLSILSMFWLFSFSQYDTHDVLYHLDSGHIPLFLRLSVLSWFLTTDFFLFCEICLMKYCSWLLYTFFPKRDELFLLVLEILYRCCEGSMGIARGYVVLMSSCLIPLSLVALLTRLGTGRNPIHVSLTYHVIQESPGGSFFFQTVPFLTFLF